MTHHTLIVLCRDTLLVMSIAGWVAAFTFILCKVAGWRSPIS